jgi:hypothetical protein
MDDPISCSSSHLARRRFCRAVSPGAAAGYVTRTFRQLTWSQASCLRATPESPGVAADRAPGWTTRSASSPGREEESAPGSA